MTLQRVLTLTVGPIAIVAVLYWLTVPPDVDTVLAATRQRDARPQSVTRNPDRPDLETACFTLADSLQSRLGDGCQVLVHPPYVLGGNITADQLERQYERVIGPMSRALSTCYFDRKPHEPITILLFSGEAAYHQFAAKLDGQHRPSYSGYYLRGRRRIILNLSTGSGTLAHELTHALAHFDFPDMPEWFDEGLASLYEESEFSEDELRLRGLSNWRLNYVLPAARRDQLQSLESLITSRRIPAGEEGLYYAHGRYFCLYLQQRQLLAHFYRKFRASSTADPTGAATLLEIMQCESLDEVDRDFRHWLVSMRKPLG